MLDHHVDGDKKLANTLSFTTMEHHCRVPTEHHRKAREQVHSETLGLREHADRGARVKNRGFRCLYSFLTVHKGYLKASLRRKLGTARCRKRKTPKVPNLGREGGCQAPQKSPPRLKTRFPLLSLHLCVGLLHRESCELSGGFEPALCPGFHVPKFQCPGATGYQFWGWCPLNFRRAAPARPPRGRMTTQTISATMQLATVSRPRACDAPSPIPPPIAE